MLDEPFALGSSPMHRLDPRVRIVSAVVYSSTVAVATRMPVLLGALAVSLVLIALARLDPAKVGKRLLAVSGFLLLLWLVLPVTYEGTPLARFGPVTATREGVWLSARITLKSWAIVLAFLALVATMPLSALGQALNRLRLPDKLVYLLLMGYRYIFVIFQEYQRLHRALRIRGFRPGTNLHTYQTYAYLIGMLFVRASDRAERVYRAMRCRGFSGTFRTLGTFPPHRGNWIFSLFITGTILGLMAVEWMPIF